MIQEETKCLVCERELKPSPTELGWVHVRHGEGVCWDCIESIYKHMEAIKRAKGIKGYHDVEEFYEE